MFIHGLILIRPAQAQGVGSLLRFNSEPMPPIFSGLNNLFKHTGSPSIKFKRFFEKWNDYKDQMSMTFVLGISTHKRSYLSRMVKIRLLLRLDSQSY